MPQKAWPWRCLATGVLSALTGGLLCAPAHAQEVVDVQLVLAVDVSLSMSPDELDIQRRGYAAALTQDSVIQAIRDGIHGRIAVTYVEWAGEYSQSVIVPWTVIATRADAETVAAKLADEVPTGARRTSISGAMKFAADLFAESGMRSLKRVIDISGDGPNNQGEPVVPIRDSIVSEGIAINGLPLMTNGGLTSSFSIENLDDYYAKCVIGGPGAFVVPVTDWEQFPEAVRRKLVIELAGGQRQKNGLQMPVIKVAMTNDIDCLVGEKVWDSRFRFWRDQELHRSP